MDEQTARFYSERAHEMALRYEGIQGVPRSLSWLAWKQGARVLDVGCGSGRDLATLARLGCEVWGVEPTAELRAEALALHPELSGRLVAGNLPDLGAPFGGGFESVSCSAVLMHVRESDRAESVRSMRRVLIARGRLRISVLAERPGIGGDHREGNGRLFEPVPIGRLLEESAAASLELVSIAYSADALGRAGFVWTTACFVAV